MQDHIVKKPDIFLYKEIKHALEKLFNNDIPRDLMLKIGISIMYYGLLWCNEILFIKIKDVVILELVHVDFPYATKRCTKGFRFKIPA